MEIIKTNGIDIHSWCPDIEESALGQMQKLAELPFARFCALMPDAHMGQNMPIGGVLATENTIVMDAIGIDIGCGVCAIKSNLTESDLTEDKSQVIFNLISQVVPTGFSHNTGKKQNQLLKSHGDKIDFIVGKSKVEKTASNPIGNYKKEFASQLGTLGGG